LHCNHEQVYYISSLKSIIMTNVDLVKQAYASFATGNVEAVLAVF
jgi:hypothetical protein